MGLIQKEIKRVTIRPNGQEKQIRPVGWKPGANTVAYYPLEQDINDYSGNNRNLSMYTGSFTYETLSSGKNICRFNTSAQTTNYTMPFNRTAYTISCYATWNTIHSQYQKILFDLVSGSNYYPRVFDHVDKVNSVVSFEAYGVSYVQNSWYHLVSVYENDVVSSYINGQFIHSETYSDSATSGTLSINGTTNYIPNYRCAGGMSELIFEDKARTAQEVSDYYNQTKGNYGL